MRRISWQDIGLLIVIFLSVIAIPLTLLAIKLDQDNRSQAMSEPQILTPANP